MLKSAIFFNNSNSNTDKNSEIMNINSALSPDNIKYGITREAREEFGSDAYLFSQEAKSGEFSILTIACDSLLHMSKNYFERNTQTETQICDLYSGLLRLALISTDFTNVKIDVVEDYTPGLIKMLSLLLKYPSHLKYLLTILINFSTIDGIENDFMYPKYGFVDSIQEILREYPYSQDSSGITEGIYWLWGNLIIDSKKARTIFFENKFTSHIAFLLSNKDVKLCTSTVKIVTQTISS